MVPKQITRRQAGLGAKPGSAFSVLTYARRVHARFCIQMPKSPLVYLVLTSRLKRYIVNHGLHALLPKRKEPFTREMIIHMLNLEPPTGKGNAPARILHLMPSYLPGPVMRSHARDLASQYYPKSCQTMRELRCCSLLPESRFSLSISHSRPLSSLTLLKVALFPLTTPWVSSPASHL